MFLHIRGRRPSAKPKQYGGILPGGPVFYPPGFDDYVLRRFRRKQKGGGMRGKRRKNIKKRRRRR